MSMKASDYSCVPLCSECHTRGPLAYHVIGKRAFERLHALRCAGIAAALRRVEGGRGGVKNYVRKLLASMFA